MRYIFYFIIFLPGLFLTYGLLAVIFPLANTPEANLFRLGMIPITSFFITYFIKICEQGVIDFQYEQIKLLLMGHIFMLFVMEIVFKIFPLNL